MQPLARTARRNLMAALTAATIAAVPAAPVLAGADRDQGVIAGVALPMIIGNGQRARDFAPAAIPVQLDRRRHAAPPPYVPPAGSLPPPYGEPLPPSPYGDALPPPPPPAYGEPLRRLPPAPYVAPSARTTSIYRTAVAQAFGEYSAAERRAIQRNLRDWGYYDGRIDGSFGTGTYEAITDYARDEGLVRNLRSVAGAYAVFDSLIY